MLALAGCGSSAKPPSTFTLADNGRVVTLATGDQAVIKLQTLNWGFQPIVGTAVKAVGNQQLVRVKKGCTAPEGCGYVALTVKAVAHGRSTITASRGLCGEDFRCPPDQRNYTIGVVVR